MQSGWIKIHRRINEHWIWQNPYYLKWWLDLIMLANHKPAKILINSKLVSIDQGMYHTSVKKLSERWSVVRKAVFRFFDLLTEDSMITIKKSRQDGTTIKLSNYAAYQAFCDNDGTSEATSEGTSTGYRRDINKNDKNDKNDQEKKETHYCPAAPGAYAQIDLPEPRGEKPARKKSKNNGASELTPDAFDTFWAAYPRKISKGDARKAWGKIQPDSELLTKMLTSLGRAKTCHDWTKDGGQFIPYPATWLRAEGWEDEIKPTRKFAQSCERRET